MENSRICFWRCGIHIVFHPDADAFRNTQVRQFLYSSSKEFLSSRSSERCARYAMQSRLLPRSSSPDLHSVALSPSLSSDPHPETPGGRLKERAEDPTMRIAWTGPSTKANKWYEMR
jgi:hypothetical protein